MKKKKGDETLKGQNCEGGPRVRKRRYIRGLDV